MIQDLRFGVRMLLKQPGFTLVAVLSLALGVGRTRQSFNCSTLRLRTLPVNSPQELAEVRLATMNGTRGSKRAQYPAVTNPIWEELRGRQQAFSSICRLEHGIASTWRREARYANARSLLVSGDFFNVLGVQPLLGRALHGGGRSAWLRRAGRRHQPRVLAA